LQSEPLFAEFDSNRLPGTEQSFRLFLSLVIIAALSDPAPASAIGSREVGFPLPERSGGADSELAFPSAPDSDGRESGRLAVPAANTFERTDRLVVRAAGVLQ
jgi:hypothetical protein